MRRKRRILAGVLTALAVLLIGARLVAAPLAQPALGFVAKVVCSAVFVGGASQAQAMADLPDDPLARLVGSRVDDSRGSVTASIPLIARRDALHREGLGCTLVPVGGSIAAVDADMPARRDAAAAATSWMDGRTNDAAPDALMPSRALLQAVEEAFAEPDPSRPRRTRAIVVVQGGSIVAERYADGYSASNRFPGWSMAKSVTNAMVGLLVGEGRLDLAAADLRPEWRDGADRRRSITLAQLMHMSSGLDFDESYTPRGGATRMLFNARDAAAAAADTPLAHEPGTHWYYSSGTTNIISAAVRSTFAGDDDAYYRYPYDRLFDRIGMRSAVLEPDAAGTFVGSSFMYASARDWARFGMLFLQDGVWDGERVLPEGWVEYSTTPAPAASRGRYGAHWWLNAGEAGDPSRRPWPDLPADIYWASGYQGQHVVVVPSLDLVIVRLGAGEIELRELVAGVIRAT
jgi:CubicO group peptidase (beta-lactamase class C family)